MDGDSEVLRKKREKHLRAKGGGTPHNMCDMAKVLQADLEPIKVDISSRATAPHYSLPCKALIGVLIFVACLMSLTLTLAATDGAHGRSFPSFWYAHRHKHSQQFQNDTVNETLALHGN